MPCDYKRYPSNWKTEIRPAILERAKGVCEWCGVPDRVWIIREPNDPAQYRQFEDANAASLSYDELWHWDPALARKTRVTQVVLTIAHVHNPDPMDCRPENLAALCQRCHLKHDGAHHAAKAKATRAKKIGQGVLI